MNLPTSILEAPYTYQPPEGYYDTPFAWVFDASGLTANQNALNQSVRIPRGFGDFYLRRVCGLYELLGSQGQFQLRNGLGLDYMSSLPSYVGGAGSNFVNDVPVMPEEVYPEGTGAIRFDLYNLQTVASTSQIVFMGVARHAGTNPMEAQWGSRAFKPVTQIYTQQTLTISPPYTNVIQKVTNFDFDLLAIELVYTSSQPLVGMQLQDAARQACSAGGQNGFINDVFFNNVRTDGIAQPSSYGMGAVEPSIFYPQNSNIVLSLSPLGGVQVTVAAVNFIGRNRIPI